jgi:hypothetical protein
MRRAAVCAVIAVAALAASAAVAALPRAGVLVVGNSLGGVQLGETESAVRAKLGSFFGICDGCAERTLYFTYRPYAPEGLAVTFRSKRAVAIYTLWRPPGWHTREGVRLGDVVAKVNKTYGQLPITQCGTYFALTRSQRDSVSVFYTVEGRLWGFGLLTPRVSVCR